MSEATNNTLRTYQDILKQMENRPSAPNSEPFRISEYTLIATQINSTAESLTQLLSVFDETKSPERFNALSERMNMLSKQAQTIGKEVVDYAFTKLLLLGVILIILSSVIVLATSSMYWILKKKFGGLGSEDNKIEVK